MIDGDNWVVKLLFGDPWLIRSPGAAKGSAAAVRGRGEPGTGETGEGASLLPYTLHHINVRRMTDPRLPTILVVDDNQDNAHIIRDYLEARGYPISVAYNGDEAMEAFEREKPSIILLDVMMPGRDGWQVCREMKEHPTMGGSIRVVMVTALQDWMNKRQALETGADDFVEKPFELSALLKVVERNAARLTPTR